MDVIVYYSTRLVNRDISDEYMWRHLIAMKCYFYIALHVSLVEFMVILGAGQIIYVLFGLPD